MKTKAKILSLILVVAIILSSLTPLTTIVNAEEERTDGSLTITKVDSEGRNPIKDVKFTIYKVGDDYTEKTVPEWYETNKESITEGTLTEGQYYKKSLTTDGSGIAKFENLPLGRYLVLEEDAPDSVPEELRTANFLVDIPRTDEDGVTLDYDVEVNPKNTLVGEDFSIEKKDRKTESTINGVTFKLQKQDKEGNYEDYGQPVQTQEDGKLKWENLPVGKYKIIETEAAEGYILDSTKEYEFEVYYDGGLSGVRLTKSAWTAKEYTKDTPAVIKNEKPEITKQVVDNEQEGNTVEFQIKVDIPTSIAELKTFKIKDTMQEGLKYIADSLNFSGEVSLTKDTDYNLTTSDDTIEIEFTDAGKAKLASLYDSVDENTALKQLTITYKANIIKDKQGSYENSATLTYSNKTDVISEDSTSTDTETPIVGGLKIKKIDGQDKSALSGAKFKIALTKEDAKQEKFLTDENGTEIEIVSTVDGTATYYGLKYGTYYLVETEAPLVPDDENGLRYNKLRQPQQITIDGTSSESEVTIQNRKGLILPLTGGIGTIAIFALGIAFIGGAVAINKKDRKK